MPVDYRASHSNLDWKGLAGVGSDRFRGLLLSATEKRTHIQGSNNTIGTLRITTTEDTIMYRSNQDVIFNLDEMEASGRTILGDFATGESALVQIKWKKEENDKKYNEMTVRGRIKLKRSVSDPTDFCLKVKPDDSSDAIQVPLPAGTRLNSSHMV